MSDYIEGWKRRAAQSRKHAEEQARAAFATARQLARILSEEYQVSEVWLAGSLAGYLQGYRSFDEHSDIDLAVRGLAPEKYYSALAHLNEVSPREVDLIDLDTCPDSLRRAVCERGVLLYERKKPAADLSK
jgi:predicted nucleotidyltransferase